MCTGMCRVTVRASAIEHVHPSMSGSAMSSVIGGRYRLPRAQQRPPPRVPATSPLKPFSRAMSSRIWRRDVVFGDQHRAGSRRPAAGQLAADGQAQAGAAVLAAGGAVGLLEGLEDDLLLVGEMPMPVSDTEKAITVGAVEVLVVRAPAGAASSTVSVTCPWWVNLKALDSRFFRICCRRLASVTIDVGRFGSGVDREVHVLGLGDVAEGALHVQLQVDRRSSLTSTTTVPDSILDRSRMSLISVSRSLPEEWIVLANSTCLGVRLPSGFLAAAGRTGSAAS